MIDKSVFELANAELEKVRNARKEYSQVIKHRFDVDIVRKMEIEDVPDLQEVLSVGDDSVVFRVGTVSFEINSKPREVMPNVWAHTVETFPGLDADHSVSFWEMRADDMLFPLHIHAWEERMYVVKGEWTFIVGDKHNFVTARSAPVVIPPHVPNGGYGGKAIIMMVAPLRRFVREP